MESLNSKSKARQVEPPQPNISFANGYQQCISTLQQTLQNQDVSGPANSKIVVSNEKPIEQNAYLQPRLDIWLAPWTSESSVLGYQPSASVIDGVSARSQAWVNGWPVLTRNPVTFSEINNCSNDHKLRNTWNAVYAIKRGVVLALGKVSKSNDYGNYVLLQHDGDPSSPVTLYAHLESIESGLVVGGRVGEGQRIGKMGASGRGAAGRVHLHLSYFSSLANILDENGELEQNIGILYHNAQNPVYFITEGSYPTNTYIGNYHSSVYEPSFFNQLYRQFHRYHEGIDFSGSQYELIDNWQQGLQGKEIVRQYRNRADIEQSPWFYELNRR